MQNFSFNPLIMIRNNPINIGFLLFAVLFRLKLLAFALNATVPVNVGVILDMETPYGKLELSCIEMALSDFYASHAYYRTRLVLHKRDSAKDVVVAAGAALDLIKYVKVQAILGPESSAQAKFVSEFGDKAHVPIVSFSATSPSLGNTYFIRVAQNDTSQVKVITAIIQAFGWSEAVPISIDNEFGKGVIPYLTTSLQAIGARIPYWVVIPALATDKQIDAELEKLMKMKTRVFIVHMSPSLGSQLFSRASAMGMMEKGFAWIVTNDMTSSFSSLNSSSIDNMQGVLGVKTYVPNTEQLESFRVRWQRKFQQNNPTLVNVKLDVFGLWAYDAAWALATAVEKVPTNFSSHKINISGSSTGLEMLEVSQSGPELVRELWGTTFTGLSGAFSLIDGQLQSSTFQVVNLNDNGERGVGYWTFQNGLVRNINSKYTSRYASSNASLGTIIWPGDTTSFPRGWQIPMSGMKLKVLVPVKIGFEEFVNVSFDPNTNTSNVTGYCHDVFKAVMDSLSYPVPYEFHPFATSEGETAGSYNDLLDQVFQGNYDAAVGDITIRASRSLYVDFTLPYTESGVSMVVPIKDKNDAKSTWVFLKPLTWELWVAIGCFFMFTGFVVLVLEHRINEDFRGPPLHQVGTSLWFSFSTMVYAQREQVVTNLARLVVMVWCFVVLILTQSYTASFSSILTVQQLQPVITDVNLLLKNGDNVGYQGGSSFIYAILKDTGFQDANLWSYDTPEQLDQLLQNGSGKHGISAAFDETPYMKLFLATYCSKYTIVEPTFSTDGFAFVFRKGSILTRDVSTAITSLHEGPEMKKIENKWFKENATCSGSSTATSSNSLILSLDNFCGLFIVAGVVSSLSLFTCAFMFYHEHKHTLNQETTFWGRLCAVMRLYDEKDPKWDKYNRNEQQQCSVHEVISATEASPNNNSSPRPSSADDIKHEIELTSLDEESSNSLEMHDSATMLQKKNTLEDIDY